MAYRFEKQETVEAGIRRIAREEIVAVIDVIDDNTVTEEETVHEARKRCKELRALVRLVRPAMEETYRLENDFFRDEARRLSHLRDAEVIIQAFDTIAPSLSNPNVIRDRLEQQKRAIEQDEKSPQEKLAQFRQNMAEARERVENWRLDNNSVSAVRSGLEKTYRRGRKAMAAAGEKLSDEALHQWRKRVKYHWYHLCLLVPVWEPVIDALQDEAHHLSDLLGDDHDLAVLTHSIHEKEAHSLINAKRETLQKEAFQLGARLFAEKPKQLSSRIEKYWTA
jgi:CHAD domain-containing protein